MKFYVLERGYGDRMSKELCKSEQSARDRFKVLMPADKNINIKILEIDVEDLLFRVVNIGSIPDIYWLEQNAKSVDVIVLR